LQLEGLQGTALWHVTITNPPNTLQEADLNQGLSNAFAHSVQLIATWQNDSEIARFNAYQGTDWFPVSTELAQLVQTTLSLSTQSQGGYDVTVRPLVKLWGFGSAEDVQHTVPDDATVQSVKARVGYEKIQVQLNPPALRKARPDVLVELASVADGFAADLAGQYLESQGIHDYMVEIAGEIRSQGQSPRGNDWRIAIEKPLDNGEAIQQGIHIKNAGLATSGDYRKFFMQGGKRYSHTIDPKTGYPVEHKLASVTVVAETGTLADGYATLLMALGEEKGKVFADEHQLAAYFIWRENDKFATYATDSFQNYLLKE
jgi:thiamine biosynthesis lipoprotein